MAISSAQKSDIISRYRQVVRDIMASFATVKGIGDQVNMLGLLDPESSNLLTPDDFAGENSTIDLARFAAAVQAMATLDALFAPEIRKPFYEVI